MAKEIPKTAKPGAQPVYQNKPLQAHVEDSYKSRGKLGDGTLCPKCGAVFHDGRWRWLPRPAQAHEEVCPACHRIADGIAGGLCQAWRANSSRSIAKKFSSSWGMSS